jgi:hypothetical protein
VIVVGILGTSGGAVLEVARRTAATGARTEVVGAAPTGATGDRLLLQLATAGVGHATVTRSNSAVADPAAGPERAAGGEPAAGPAAQPEIEPADLELALRYLPDVRAIVLVEPPASLLATAVAATSFAGATLIVVGPVEATALDALAAPLPIVLDPPAHDPDGAFAGVVAALATRLDAGEDPAGAWAATVTSLAVEPASRPSGRDRAF